MPLQEKLLEEFDAILRQYNPVNYSRLQPPLPEKEIDLYLDKFGLEEDKDIKLLFSWKNGFDFSKGESMSYNIFYFGALMSLEHINTYLQHQNEPEYNLKGDKVFLPLVVNGSGDSLLYNLTKKGYGRIHRFSVPLLFIQHPISYYDSLSAMIKTTIHAYKEGIFRYDNIEDDIDIGIDAYYDISKKINKASKYWRLDT